MAHVWGVECIGHMAGMAVALIEMEKSRHFCCVEVEPCHCQRSSIILLGLLLAKKKPIVAFSTCKSKNLFRKR